MCFKLDVKEVSYSSLWPLSLSLTDKCYSPAHDKVR